MLREISSSANADQDRRWFQGQRIDLMMWFRDKQCCRILIFEKECSDSSPLNAVRWTVEHGITWHEIDEGHAHPNRHKGSDLLRPSPAGNIRLFQNYLVDEGAEIEPSLLSAVLAILS